MPISIPRTVILLLLSGCALNLAQTTWAQPPNSRAMREFTDAFITVERAKLVDRAAREGDKFDPVREREKLRQKHEKVFGTSISDGMLDDFDRVARDAINRPQSSANIDPATGKSRSVTDTSSKLFIANARMKFMEDIREERDKFDTPKELAKLNERYERNFGVPMPMDVQRELQGSADRVRGILVQERATMEARTKETSATTSSKDPPKGAAARGVRYPAGLPGWFQEHDLNQDGQVALSEWDRDKLDEFRQWDRNGDGFLAPLEVLQVYRKQMPMTTSTSKSSGMK